MPMYLLGRFWLSSGQTDRARDIHTCFVRRHVSGKGESEVPIAGGFYHDHSLSLG